MGGLLDKASGYSDSVHQGDNVESKVINEPSAIIDAYEKGKSAATSGGLLAKADSDSDDPPTAAARTTGGDEGDGSSQGPILLVVKSFQPDLGSHSRFEQAHIPGFYIPLHLHSLLLADDEEGASSLDDIPFLSATLSNRAINWSFYFGM